MARLWNRHVRKTAFLAGASLAACLAGASPARAQDDPAATAAVEESDDETIYVTATKREQTLLEVPFSINAQTEEDIRRSGASNIEDLSRNVAGLAVQNLGPGQSQVSVRGVSAGQVVRDQPGVKEQVGVYLDESVISLSLFTPDLDLFDLNRVETLRGPQGTLFGSGSVGGTIRYITNQPRLGVSEGALEGNVNFVSGDDFGGHLKGAINVPFGDKGAMRAVAYHTKYGGFIDALREGGTIDDDVNGGRRTGGRLSFLFQPTDNIRITPRILYQEVRANGFNRQEVFNLFANPYTTTRPRVTFDEQEQFLLLRETFKDDTFLADLTASIGFGGVELTSVSSFISRDLYVGRDASALTGSVSVDLGYAAAAVTLPSNLVDTTELETFTQELRLGSTGDGPLQWVAGLFYSKIDRFYHQRLPTPGYDVFTDARFGAGTSAAVANGFPLNSPYNSDLPYDITQKAVFGEATYDFGRFELTAGGRYYDFKEERQFKSGGLFSNGDNRFDTTKSDGFTPRVILSYEVSDDIRVNAQAAKGFRLGGVNDPLNLPLCSAADAALFGSFQSYNDETLWNYEGGIKGSIGGINFNAAGFYTDIKNLQVTLDAGSCSSRIVFNVPKSHTMGVEFELSTRPATGLALSIAGSLIEAEFDSTLPEPLATSTGIRNGNRFASVPKFQMAATGTYSAPINGRGDEVFVTGSVQHVGSRYTQPSDQELNPRTFRSGLAFGGATGNEATILNLKLPDYQLVNLSAGLEFKSGMTITAYIHNVFDENPILSFDRERGGRARLGFSVGQPRTFGLTVRQDF